MRDVGCGGFKVQLQNLLTEHNPNIIILMEIKVKSNRAQQVIQSLNISNHVEISPEGFSRDYGFSGLRKSFLNIDSIF